MKWFKKKHEGDKPITIDAAIGLWLTCPNWLGDILTRLDNRVKEVDETLVGSRAQMLQALELVADQNEELRKGLLALNDRVVQLEMALVEADKALVQATVGPSREGARH